MILSASLRPSGPYNVASLLIALLPIGLLLAAALLALRPLRTSGRHPGWIALASGLAMLALKQVVESPALRGAAPATGLPAGAFVDAGTAALLLLGTLGVQALLGRARREAEELALKEARARAVLDALPDVCFRLGADGTILCLDPKEQETSFDTDRAVGMMVEDSGVSPELAGFLRTLLRDTLREGRGLLRVMEVPLRGETRVREVRTNPSGPYEVLFLVRDITEQRRAEEARRRDLEARARELEARQQDRQNLDEVLLDAIPLPVFVMDRSGRCTGCSPAFAELLGRCRLEILGRPVEELFPPDQAARFRNPEEEPGEPGGLRVHQVRMWHAGLEEDRDIRCIQVPIRAEGQELAGSLVVLEDITEPERIDAVPLPAQGMQGTGSPGSGTGGLVYDFKDLLQGIQGSLEVAQLLGHPEGVPGQAIAQALDGVAKATELAERMLESADPDGGEPEDLDFGQILWEKPSGIPPAH